FQVQPFFAVEVVVDQLLVHPRPRRDFLHPGAREPFGGELFQSGRQQQTPRAVGVLLAFPGRRRPTRPDSAGRQPARLPKTDPMTTLTDAQVAYLTIQRLGRPATVD